MLAPIRIPRSAPLDCIGRRLLEGTVGDTTPLDVSRIGDGQSRSVAATNSACTTINHCAGRAVRDAEAGQSDPAPMPIRILTGAARTRREIRRAESKSAGTRGSPAPSPRKPDMQAQRLVRGTAPWLMADR